VSFKVITRGGKPIKVANFAVTKVPAHCQNGRGTVGEKFGVLPNVPHQPPPQTLKVAKDGRFSGTFIPTTMPPGQRFTVTGTLTEGGKRASGTLNINQSNPPPTGACMTGTKAWSARAG
jgi:hypothetical protein